MTKTSETVRMPGLRLAVLGLIAALSLGPVGPVSAAAYLRVPDRAMGSTQAISIEVNKSILVDLPTNVGEVIASAPQVATVVMRSKTRAVVQGLTGGDTNIFFLDGAGNNIAVLDIKVIQPRSDVGNALESAIARTIPGSAIRVESVLLDGATNRVVLSGTAASQDDLDKAVQIATQFAGDPANVANIATVAGNQQVMLKVTVAEVNREATKKLGINLSSTFNILGNDVSFSNSVIDSADLSSSGDPNNGVSASWDIGSSSIDVKLQALEDQEAVRKLAEPLLTALSGQEASFHAGGQVRYASGEDDQGNTIYSYQPYGIDLKFTPTVKSNGTVSLVVSTSVSEVEADLSINDRNVSTTAELKVGQTLSIAGLFSDTVRQQISKFPGLGDVPILGALFRSRSYISSKSELVFLVTPYLAATGRPTLPTDTMQVSSDAEAIFLGRMEKLYGVDGGDMRGSYSGSVGFVLD